VAVGLICNLLVRPFDDKWRVTDENGALSTTWRVKKRRFQQGLSKSA